MNIVDPEQIRTEVATAFRDECAGDQHLATPGSDTVVDVVNASRTVGLAATVSAGQGLSPPARGAGPDVH